MANGNEQQLEQSVTQSNAQNEANIEDAVSILNPLVEQGELDEAGVERFRRVLSGEGNTRPTLDTSNIETPEPGRVNAGNQPVPDTPTVPETPEEREFDSTARSIVNSVAGIGTEDLSPEQQEFIQGQVDRLDTGKEEKQGIVNKIKGFLTGETQASVQESEFEERGGEEAFLKVQKLRPEVAKLEGQINELNLKEERALEQAEQSLASVGTIEANKTRIRREFRREKADLAATLGAKASLMEAWQGNLNTARALASDAASAFASERRFQSGILGTLLSEQSDWVNSLEDETKTYLGDLRDFNLREADDLEDRYKSVADLATSAAIRGVDLGWTDKQIKDYASSREGLNTALQDFNTKVAPVTAQQDTTDTGTQTERAISNALGSLTEVTKEDGTVSLDDFLTIRSASAMNTDQFNTRFAPQFLSEDEQDQLQQLNFGVSNNQLY